MGVGVNVTAMMSVVSVLGSGGLFVMKDFE